MIPTDQNKSEMFFKPSINKFRRVPPEELGISDSFTRPALVGLTAAAGDYLVGSHLFGADRSSDEMSAFFALAAGALIGSIRNVRSLCAMDPERKAQDRFNVAKAGAGGALAGAGLIKLLPVAIATLPVDGGLTFGGLVIASAGAFIYNRSKKTKYCPHLDCREKGHCSESVCRHCCRLFYPKETKIDCGDTRVLTWDRIASHLQRQQLSYLDSELLVRNHIGDWQVYPNADGTQVSVDCQDFLNWTENNKKLVMSYQGKGRNGRSDTDIDEYLRKSGL